MNLMSSPEQNKVNLMRFYEEVVNQGNLDAIDELVSPDFVHHGETLFPQILGNQPLKVGIGGVRAAYPDGHTVVEDMVAEGDTVVCRLAWTGTHKGAPFMGVQPNGAHSSWHGISTYRFNDESKIIERWANMDVMSQLQDMGLVPKFELGGAGD
jgi:predicted ester cyclase